LPEDYWHSTAAIGCVFPVPFDELPATSQLPMHAGGMAHLTVTDLPAWLWERLQHMDRVVHQMDDTSVPLYDGRVNHVVGLARQISKSTFFVGKPGDVVIEDIEDLVVAPCLRRVLDNRSRFPKHEERFPLARALQSAGVTLEQADEIFTRLGEAGQTKEQVAARNWNW
jgi:hypothetical protein